MNYIYIFLTIIFTVYGQVILKWRLTNFTNIPEELIPKFFFLLKLLVDPFIASAFFSAFLAALSWMAAMTKFEISFAYPFMSLNFILVLLLSSLFLSEVVSIGKIFGLVLIVIGLIISVRF